MSQSVELSCKTESTDMQDLPSGMMGLSYYFELCRLLVKHENLFSCTISLFFVGSIDLCWLTNCHFNIFDSASVLRC